MGDVSHEQVNLMLRLYDIRREPRLREAREWFMNNFRPASPEDVMRQYPPASQENAYFRMVMSYWEMVAGIVNRGLIDEEMFFENSGEQWIVWERLKPVIARGANSSRTRTCLQTWNNIANGSRLGGKNAHPEPPRPCVTCSRKWKRPPPAAKSSRFAR